MKNLKIPIRTKSTAILFGFALSIIVYAGIIVVIGPVLNNPIPHLVDCSNEICDFTNLGSSVIEVLIGIFIAMLIFKLQKDHSKKLSEVQSDITEKVYSRKIIEYTCDFQLDEVVDKNSENGEAEAEERAKKRADEFIRNIEKDAKSITDSEISGRGESHIIELSKGIIEIALPKVRPTSKEGGTKSCNIHLKTENLELLDDVIRINKHPYWDFQWHIEEKYDVQQLIKIVEDKSGRKPMSKSGGSGENSVWTRATYHLMEVNEHKFGITISTEMISLTCYSSTVNGGIFQAHKLLNPGKLVSILLGEMKHEDLKKLLENLFIL